MEEKTGYEIVRRQELSPAIWRMFLEIDQATYSSRRFGVTQGETAIKLIFCLENSLPLSAANTGLYIVNGRLGVQGNVIAAKLRQHPRYDYEIVSLSDTGCTIGIFRDDQEIGQATFDQEDAKRAGLLGKDNWQGYPEEMYFNRTISKAYKLLAPDLFMSPVYVAEEIMDITPVTQYDGATLENLLAIYSPEQILDANDGKLPSTEEEIEIVRVRLEGE